MRFVFALLIIACAIAVLIAISFAYEWLRCRMNRPRIGLEYFLCKLLRRGDYVSINGRIMDFSHITKNGETIDPVLPLSNNNQTLEGELAFYNPHSLGYLIYPVSALRKCEFIYGKYGLKWAVSDYWATIAKDKVDEAICK